MSLLEEVYQAYARDPMFDELRVEATRLVEGFGHMKPMILFVGEAPGKDEDRRGRPFVGASGRLLDELCQERKISRIPGPERVRYKAFTTNIVKYRPPNNRDPSAKEIDASIWYLDEEIKILQPKVVVTLGRYPMKAVWPDAPPISQCHGAIRTMASGLKHVPMYHPAFGIYDPRNRDVLRRDFALLASLLEEL